MAIKEGKTQFSTTISTEVMEKFRKACEDLPAGVGLNTIVEGLMNDFADGKVDVHLTLSVSNKKK